MRPARFVFSAAATTAVALAQTTAGSGALILNGTAVGPIQPGLVAFAQFDAGIDRTVSLTSTGNLSGANITITGLTTNNVAVSQTIAGPNNNTVFTTTLFNRVTAVSTDGALATAMSVGSGTTGVTNWYTLDYFQSPVSVGLWLQITATISVTVQLTPDPFTSTAAVPHTFNHAYLTAITSDAASALPYGARGVRALINSSSGSGAAIFTVIQAGAGVP